MLTEVERRVLAAVDDVRVIEDLRDLVQIPSVDGTPAESDVQAWCAERLAALGLIVDKWPIDLPTLTADPEFPGMEVERGEAWGCVGVLGGDGTPGLILNGHVDVVPGDAFDGRIADGVMWGRGTCDMKGGDRGDPRRDGGDCCGRRLFARPLAVHSVSGEEDGGIGAYATLRRGHPARPASSRSRRPDPSSRPTPAR